MAGIAAASDAVGTGAFVLHCRGDVRLYCGQADCTPKSKKGRALLAILAAEQRALTRVKIIDLLWSDRQEEQARASLRTLLADLREQFNSRFDELLVVERERVALGPEVSTDLADPTLARPAGELFEGLDHIDPELDDWLRVERERWSNGKVAGTTGQAPAPAKEGMQPRWRIVAAILLALAAVAAFLYSRSLPNDGEATIAVLAFEDLSGDHSLLARGLSEQLRVELALQRGIGVISGQSSQSRSVTNKDARETARILGATHVVEGSVLPFEGAIQLSLRVIDGRSGAILWSHQGTADPPEIVGGGDPLAQKIAGVVGTVATDSAPPEAMAADSASYQQVFEARALMRTNDPAEQLKARAMMAPVVARYPNFVPALITLAESNIATSDAPGMNGKVPIEQARKVALHFARRAIRLAPDYGPAYTAMGSAYFNMKEGIGYDEIAAQLSPGSGSAHLNWGIALSRLGRWDEAVGELKRAAQLDPLGQSAQFYFAQALVETGKRQDAAAVLRKYLAGAVDDQVKRELLPSIASNLFTDLARALVAARRAVEADPQSNYAIANAMTEYRRLYGRKAAAPFAQNHDSLSALAVLDDRGRMRSRVSELGRDFWAADYDVNVAGQYLVARGFGADLVRAFDRAIAAGMDRDDDVFGSEPLAVALRQAGRTREADRIVAQIRRQLERERGRDYRRLAYRWALLYALEGRREEALTALEHAIRHRSWIVNDVVDSPLEHVALTPIRRDPRHQSLRQLFDADIAAARAEAERLQRTAAGAPARAV